MKPRRRALTPFSLGFLVLMAAVGLVACSCRGQAQRPVSGPSKPPSVRLYVLSNVAGALEPCGCVKDMLGGVDHAAALIQSRRSEAPHSLAVAAGPTMFMDPRLDDERRTQELWKAETLAASLKAMGVRAWTPGFNDFAAGPESLERLRAKSGAAPLAANLRGQPKFETTTVVDVGGYKIGIAGITRPEYGGLTPAGVEVTPPEPALTAARDQLKAAGAQILVALVALPRGLAIRAAEAVPEFDVIVVGKPFESGDANDKQTPPQLVGGTLVVQPPNHLQAIGLVDLYVQGGDFNFKDGSGLADIERKDSLERRVHDLEQRIKEWEHQRTSIRPEDLKARRADLAAARKELQALRDKPKPQAAGSYFRYELVQVREQLGSEPAVQGLLGEYYRRVNEHNRVAFQDRRPAPVPPDASGYLGIEVCSSCHTEEREFWNTTRHAKAYATLVDGNKQFNLDCVGCHVTGYEKPGGSTVTHVENLTSVQCEVCHGPGSRHLNDPKNPAFIARTPEQNLCASACHHPPHVHADWNVAEAWKHIVGPGHGAPK